MQVGTRSYWCDTLHSYSLGPPCDRHTDTTTATNQPVTPAAVEATNAWTPRMDRRTSWSREERKHEVHMALASEGGPGFSEKK